MSIDLLIPFGILLILVVYLIFTRNNFEKDITKLYEEKFSSYNPMIVILRPTKSGFKERFGGCQVFSGQFNVIHFFVLIHMCSLIAGCDRSVVGNRSGFPLSALM